MEDYKQLSEELTTKLADMAQTIARDSKLMRLNIQRIEDILLPIISKSAIQFGGSDTWHSGGKTCRIGIRNDNRWIFGVEMSSGCSSDGKGHGWEDVFCDEAYDTTWEVAKIWSFSAIGATTLAHVATHLPNFLEEYLNELDATSEKYADLLTKTNVTRDVVERLRC
jgi:hypothetical protein